MSSKNRSKGKRRRRNPKRSTDAIVLKGSQIYAALATSTSSAALFPTSVGYSPLKVINFGSRPSAIGAVYARFRYKSLRIEYIPACGSNTSGALSIGVIDDADTPDNIADIANYNMVTQLRKSLDTPVWSKKQFVWVPLDRGKWYYVDSSAEGTDSERFVVPGTVFAYANLPNLNSNTTIGYIRIHYTIEFEGAIPTITPD